MKTALGILAAACILALGCRGNSKLTRKNQQYDVVQEGTASGVTSTINGPGENVPPVNTTPITGTGANADTTTAFTLPTATEGAPTGEGTLAATLPAQDSSGRMSTGAPPRMPSPRPRPMPTQRAEPMPTPPREAQPTTTAPSTRLPTDTAATTSTSSDTQPSPENRTRGRDNPPPPGNNPPPDQQAPPPPPPSRA
jgi:hypothetical protein